MTSNSEENIEAVPPQPDKDTESKPTATTTSFRWWMVAAPLAICLVLFFITIGLIIGLWQGGDTTALSLEAANEAAEEILVEAEESVNTPSAVINGTPAPSDSSSGDADSISNPADTTEPVPAVCTETGLQSSPTITQPIFSPISFGTTSGPNGWALDAGVQFTTAVTQIQATFTFTGMENGLAWERAWYFGDQELVRGSGNWDAGPAGHLSLFTQVQEQSFVPGRYRLELLVEDELAVEGSFVLLDETTAVTQAMQLAHTVWDGERHQLFVNRLNGLTTTSQITATQATTQPLLNFARHPAWSLDTLGLLFYGEAGIEQEQEDGTAGLWVFNTGLQQAFQVNEATGITSLAWSPRRNYIASASEDNRLTLWHLGENKAFPGPPGQDPAWAPDGLRLAYRGCSQNGWGIYLAQVIGRIVDENSIQQITVGNDSHPSWSMDGQQLVFSRQAGNNEDILLVNINNGEVEPLTSSDDVETTPVWTPEGQIIYYAQRDGDWGLYIMDADGSNSRLLLDTPAAADWEPDVPAISSNEKLIEPTPPPPPNPRVQVPAGMGILVISNLKNPDEMTFTINNGEHKVGPYTYRTIPLPPGHYTWSASWPARVGRQGIADVVLGRVAYPVVER